jgi:hypothetical protein
MERYSKQRSNGVETNEFDGFLIIKDDSSYSASLIDDAVGSTGITETSGIFKVSYVSGGDTYSAIFALYDNAGTPTTVLLAGNGTNFSITATTDTKVNCYWATDQLKIENKSGGTLTIKCSGVVFE